MLEYEEELYNSGINLICGVDEVGRGPLIGPVVTAAVILPKGYVNTEIKDSKKLSEKKREKLYKEIMYNAIDVSISSVSEKVIDEINILEATKKSMIESIKGLKVKPEHVLIDAVKLNIDIPSSSIIKGDAKSQSIAAASIIAKVYRDNIMKEIDKEYPMYDFKNNKGYGTKKHIEALRKYGPTPYHRKSFAPVSEILNDSSVKSK